MAPDTLTTKEYWTEQISNFQPFEVNGNEFEAILNKYLPVNPDFTCVEIGAYPGSNLCYLAKQFKYKPTAIEYRDDVADIRQLFEYNGIPDVEIINKNFLELTGLQFDVVTSIGFIEHFRNYEAIIKQHEEMVKPGGYLVIALPHYWGFQGLLRRALLKKEALREMLEAHNLEIMKLTNLNNHIRATGLNILYSSYTMGCRFWIPSSSNKVKPEMRWLARIFELLDKHVLLRMPPCFLYSPMILCVAKKLN